ncbi:MAG: hypothetical protein ACR2QJ_16290 [Geminicoccaceae bacterium]
MGVMIFVRSVALMIAFLVGASLVTPVAAQTNATLNVTARVVQECTVIAKSKRELVKLARRLNDPSIIQRCSKGVVSRVDKKTVKISRFPTRSAVSGKTSKKRVTRSTIGAKADVILVTVSY